MPTPTLCHAWFSKKAESLCSSLEMDTPDGRVVRITAIADHPNAQYLWDDKVYIGMVIDGTQRNRAFQSDFNPAPKPLVEGDVCPRCGHEYKLRHLFFSSYMGCHC